MSKQTRSNLLNALLIIGTIGAVLIIGAVNGDIDDAWSTMISADPGYLALAIASFGVFVLFEALTTFLFFRYQQVPIRVRTCVLVTLIGLFYSNVTPGSTGGQPLQVITLKKRGIPSGYTSSALAVKFFCFQTALLFLGTVLWIANWDFSFGHIGPVRWLIYLGYFINTLGVAGVVLLAINRTMVRNTLLFFIRLGQKIRLVRDIDKTTKRLDKALNDFHTSVDMMTHQPLRLFSIFLISCVQVMGLMSIVYFVTLALGVKEYGYFQIVTLQFLLYIGVSFTPTPGASGSQEGGFYLIFNRVFPAGKLLGALLVWRFFTYYFSMIISLVFGVLPDSVKTMRGTIKKVPLPRSAEQRLGSEEEHEPD